MTTEEAAKELGYAVDTIRRYVYRGLIVASKFGNQVAISRAEVERFRKERRAPGRPVEKKPKKSA
ncbi:MAG: helix-turn-helix domain-containing protein [Pirellulales bacterium]